MGLLFRSPGVTLVLVAWLVLLPRAGAEEPREGEFWVEGAEGCHALALLPPESSAHDSAALLLVLGRYVPVSVPKEGLSIRDAFEDGRLGPVVFGVATQDPLWGNASGRIETDRTLLDDFGLCVNPKGGLLGNPDWDVTHPKNYPILATCEGWAGANVGIWLPNHLDAADRHEWKSSGVLAADIAPKIRRMAEATAHELVCVQEETESERRMERAEARPTSQEPNEG